MFISVISQCAGSRLFEYNEIYFRSPKICWCVVEWLTFKGLNKYSMTFFTPFLALQICNISWTDMILTYVCISQLSVYIFSKHFMILNFAVIVFISLNVVKSTFI